jgi:hypothetical protein
MLSKKIVLALAYLTAIQTSGVVFLFVWRKFDTNTTLPDQIFFISVILGVLSAILFKLHNRFFLHKKFQELGTIILLGSILSVVFFINLGLQSFTNVDRSRSFYIFQWVECSEGRVDAKNLRVLILNKYGEDELKSYDKRLIEQKKRGLIKEMDGYLFTTTNSRFILKISDFLAIKFSLDGWFSHPLIEKCR